MGQYSTMLTVTGGSEMGSPFIDGKAGAQRGTWLIKDGFSSFFFFNIYCN